MSNRRMFNLFAMAACTSLVLAACAQAAPQQKVVEVTKEVVKEVEKQVVVTATPDPNAAAPTEAPAAAPAGEKAKVLRVNTGTYPDTIDPQKSSFVNEIAHLKLIYEGLMKFNTKLETIPGSAEKYDVNKDATEFTFHLRKGLKYSDGSVLNAKRFEYSIIRNINPATAGEYGTITNEVAGAPEWQDNTAAAKDEKASDADKKKAADAAAAGEKMVRESVVALDADGKPCADIKDGDTVKTKAYDREDCLDLKMKLSKPAPYWPTIMALWVTFPAKEENIDNGKFTDWFNYTKFQVGNGPFKLTSLTPFEKGIFAPNENYYGGAPKYGIEYSYVTDSAVAFQAYKNNEFDVVILAAEDLATVQNDAELSKQANINPGSCTQAVQLRQFAKPFDDPKVRQAFAQAIDRDRWVTDVLKGLGASTQTWIPKGYPGWKEGETRWAYNADAANKAISESSYKTVDALPQITLSFADNPRNRARYEWLGARFKEVFAGLKLELNPVEPTQFTAMQKDKNSGLQMFIAGWCADYPDPQNWLSVYWKSTTTFAQRIGYVNKDFDAMTEQADKELDAAKRADLYQQAQDKLVDDSPVVFVWNSVNSYLVKPWVKGFEQTPQDGVFPGDVNPMSIDIDTAAIP